MSFKLIRRVDLQIGVKFAVLPVILKMEDLLRVEIYNKGEF